MPKPNCRGAPVNLIVASRRSRGPTIFTFKSVQAPRRSQSACSERHCKKKGARRDEAVVWLREAAATLPVAQFALARCYLDGVGVAKDEASAFKMYQHAAQHGDVDSLGSLGYCYRLGIGTMKDVVRLYVFVTLVCGTHISGTHVCTHVDTHAFALGRAMKCFGRHTTMPPCCHTTMPPCCHVTMPPCHHATMSPCHYVIMPPHVAEGPSTHISHVSCTLVLLRANFEVLVSCFQNFSEFLRNHWAAPRW